MRWRLVFSWIALLMFLLPAQHTRADSGEAKITADEMTYDYYSKQMEASGNVQIVYKDITVECERAFMDQTQNVLLAKGKVRITKNDSVYHGDSFIYYLINEQGLLSPIQAEVRDAEINGPVQLKAAEGYFQEETVITRNSTLSGCNREKPHYHLTAKEVEYYPGDRVVLRRVWYWEHGVPLFYVPFFFISLKPDRDNNNFNFEIGHNDTEGWFVKTGYNYIWDSKNYGKITSRLTEKGSDELGVTHYYDFSPTSKFYQDYHYINNRKLGYPNPDYKLGFGYENSTNPKMKFSTAVENWNQSYIYFNGIKQDLKQQKRALNLRITGQSPYPSLNLNFAGNTGTGEYLDDLNGSWSYNPDASSNISINSRWFYEDKLNTASSNPLSVPHFTTNSFKYSGSFRKDWGWSNVSLNYDETMVFSENSSNNNVKPDIIYTIPKWKLPLFGDFKVSGGYLSLEKITKINNIISQETGYRQALDIQKLPLKLWQTEHTTVNWESKFFYRDFRVNGSETEFYALTTDLGLIEQFTKKFSTEVRVGYAGTYGIQNYFFGRTGDSILDGAYLTNEWRWQSQGFNASLKGGYNFKNAIADPVVFWTRWTPAPGQEVYFDTLYDWKVGLKSTNLRANYSPKDNWRLALNAGYDFSTGLWSSKQFEALIAQQLTAKWQLELSVKYDTLRDAFTDAQTGFVYDWHCRKLKIHYDWLTDQYWLQLTFNIFPDVPLKYSSESQFEGLLDEIKF
jgi:lipopolysaccharide export system protein LptA